LWILTNKEKSTTIIEIISSNYTVKKDTVILDLDRRVTVTPEELEICAVANAS